MIRPDLVIAELGRQLSDVIDEILAGRVEPGKT